MGEEAAALPVHLVAQPTLNLKPPQPLSLDGDIYENWTKWLKKFKIYLNATESNEKPD